jgi:hypothetical protein
MLGILRMFLMGFWGVFFSANRWGGFLVNFSSRLSPDFKYQAWTSNQDLQQLNGVQKFP